MLLPFRALVGDKSTITDNTFTSISPVLLGPLFIFQWQYDLTQMIAENPGTGLKRGRDMIKRIFKLAADMKQSLKDQLVRYRIDFLRQIWI